MFKWVFRDICVRAGFWTDLCKQTLLRTLYYIKKAFNGLLSFVVSARKMPCSKKSTERRISQTRLCVLICKKKRRNRMVRYQLLYRIGITIYYVLFVILLKWWKKKLNLYTTHFLDTQYRSRNRYSYKCITDIIYKPQ